jgi:hypothetical protein
MVHGLAAQDVEVTTVPPPVGVATTWYPVMLTPPVKPGAITETVIP